MRPALTEMVEPAAARLVAGGTVSSAAGRALRTSVSAERSALVHGSLDPDNVIVTRQGRVVLLDLEACRRGFPSFDVASMAGGLAVEADDACGIAWLRAAAQLAPSGNVAAFLAIRACHRADAGAMVGDELDRLAAMISWLVDEPQRRR